MHARDKRLNEMNRLRDMGHFPALVNAGATVNVLATMLATWWIAPRWPAWAAVWLAGVLALNLLPVVLLRLTLTPATVYPRLGEMNFVHDQHKFSDWVYVAASADMAVWVLLTWTCATVRIAKTPLHTSATLAALLVLAALCTFSPVLLRGRKRG